MPNPPRTPRKNQGTTFKFKADANDPYEPITGVMKFKLPVGKPGQEDMTPVEADVEIEANVIPNYSELELEITWDEEDPVHQAMEVALTSGVDCFVEATLASGRKLEYEGNAKEPDFTDGTAKNHRRRMWKMHPNKTPVPTPPP